MKFYFDQVGSPHAEGSEKHEALIGFLESDVQVSPASCREILSIVEEIQSGLRSSWEETGNSHTIDIENGIVSIVNDFSDSIPVCKITVEEFKNVVQEWLDVIESLPEFQ